MIRMDYESVQEMADALSHASSSCIDAATESKRSRAQVVQSIESIATSQRRVENLITAMKDTLELTEYKASCVTWEGESYDQFFAEVKRQRDNLRQVEQQYSEAYEESLETFERLRQRIVQLDENFGHHCGKASAAYDTMANRSRRHAQEIRDVANRGL